MTEIQAPYLAENHKEWKCLSCGAVLGHSFKHNGIYRLSLRNIIATGAIEVLCNCGTIREWHSDAEGIKRLVEMTGRKYTNG